jgi:hypothetical protein
MDASWMLYSTSDHKTVPSFYDGKIFSGRGLDANRLKRMAGLAGKTSQVLRERVNCFAEIESLDVARLLEPALSCGSQLYPRIL